MSAWGAATNAGAEPVPAGFALDEAALGRWLAQHGDGYAGPLAIHPFKGGQSNPTHRLGAPSGGLANVTVVERL